LATDYDSVLLYFNGDSSGKLFATGWFNGVSGYGQAWVFSGASWVLFGTPRPPSPTIHYNMIFEAKIVSPFAYFLFYDMCRRQKQK
jgi:hypothetical protein